ncbi:N-acetylglucosaminyltransferase [Teredinibacter haidensis]|uniref:N-acetylglucosaminyltransferase n=1 Tax=Teredinibacter haidensis TaxID=2731755 RepID=UPI000AFF3B8E|nr:N-acetylglucosaminyltransferase [Teredinibacter haidensis]
MRFLITICIAILLSACAGTQVKPVDTAAGTTVDVGTITEPASQPIFEQRLMQQAEKAFRRGRLISPAHDNAYDRFHAVLLMNPDNATANAGLQAIVIRYAELIRDALGHSRYHQATGFMRVAQQYFPGNPLLVKLQRELAETRRHKSQSRVGPTPDVAVVDEFSLSVQLLNDSPEQLVPLLFSIAERVKVRNESVMIYARTDTEGRWIYRQLKKAVPGYRVRGDIRLAKRPKITVMPPL